MIAAGWGRIVTISSSSALPGAPRMAHYAVSKAGVIGLTKTLARELAKTGIALNSIPPRWWTRQWRGLRSQRAGQRGRDGRSGAPGTCGDSR